MKPTVSVVISAFNEEQSLARCLESVRFADEIIVVDNSSTDQTASIAKRFTKHVFNKKNILMLNTNKNFGFSKATCDWILNLDADEYVTPLLVDEIRTVISGKDSFSGYWIKRKNISFGKWIQHGLWWPDKQLRLFRRGHGEFPCKHIHEYIKVDGLTGELDEPYMHHNYVSIHQYLTKIDRASTSEALVLQDSRYHLAWYDAVRFPVSDFLKIYFAQSGWRDGLHGLVLSLLQSFYSFCVFAKLWEMQSFPERDIAPNAIVSELGRAKNEFSYWIFTLLRSENISPLRKVYFSVLRKLSGIRASS